MVKLFYGLIFSLALVVSRILYPCEVYLRASSSAYCSSHDLRMRILLTLMRMRIFL